LVLALVVAIVVVVFLLRSTRWGLRLKAVGQNPDAAMLFGLKPNKRILEAMVACGMLAGSRTLLFAISA
jgi:simple sugar transport system permease protein